MDIITEPAPTMTLEAFADTHRLTMRATERPNVPLSSPTRWYASFDNVWVVEPNGVILHGAYGDGRTAEDAIANYAAFISQRRIKIEDQHKSRYLDVPTLTSA